MPNSTIQQKEEIDQSASYSDALTMADWNTAVSLEDDLNFLRSKLKEMQETTNWYDDVPESITDLAARSKLEDKLAIYPVQVLTDITVGGSDNWVVLSVSGSEAPSLNIATGASTKGAITALLPGPSGTHSLNEIAGINAINPKNLVRIVDGSTGDPILSSGKEIMGLLQAESGSVDGTAFNDTTQQGQISFVRVNATNDDLEACPAGDIQGKTINYLYNERIALDDVNEQRFSGNYVFADQSGSVDVTLQNAITNQSGAVTQGAKSIDIQLTDTYEWQFSDASGNAIAVAKAASGGDTFEVGDATNAAKLVVFGLTELKDSLQVDTGVQTINIGTTQGRIDSTALELESTSGNLVLDAASNLNLEAGAELNFSDSRQTSALPLTDASNTSLTGSPASLFAAINAAKAGGISDPKWANTTGAVSANTVIVGPGGNSTQNLSADLIDYTGKDFVTKVLISINGQLKRPGADASANHDVYPATNATDISAGGFFAEKNVKNNANIMMVVLD